MRAVAILALVALLGAGLVVSYLVYRQLETKTVVFADEVVLERTDEGGRCGSVNFVVDARTMGQWALVIDEGEVISGYVAVEGDKALDVGLSITSPSNRLVHWGGDPEHVQQFEVSETIRGAYAFEFDNRHSTLTSKSVTVAVCVA